MTQVVTDLAADIGDAIDLIGSVFTTLWDAVKPFLTDQDTFTQTSMSDFFVSLETTVDDAVTLMKQLLDTVLDAVKAAVAGIQDLLDYQFQAVPVIGDLLELAGIDTTLSIAHLVGLIVSYPTTLINEIIGGGPLFPSDNTPTSEVGGSNHRDAATTTPEVGSSNRVDGWGVGLNWMSAVTQFVWSVNDFVLDESSGRKGPNAFNGNALTTSLDIICPVVINMLQFPSPTTAAGLTQPFWYGLNDQGSGTDLLPWMLFTAFIPPATGILALLCTEFDPDEAEDFSDYGVPIFCAVAGVANTVISSIYSHDQGVSPLLITAGVLSNVSYDVAPLGFPALNDAFDKVPNIAKLIVDTIANFGSVLPMAGQAIAAAVRPLKGRIPLRARGSRCLGVESMGGVGWLIAVGDHA